jgi:hypothetical protein
LEHRSARPPHAARVYSLVNIVNSKGTGCPRFSRLLHNPVKHGGVWSAREKPGHPVTNELTILTNEYTRTSVVRRAEGDVRASGVRARSVCCMRGARARGGSAEQEGEYEKAGGRGRYTPHCYCSFAYSALASFRMGMSGSASFQSVRKSWYSTRALEVSPERE